MNTPCTRSASTRHCRHLDAAHLSIPLHPSRDDVVLSDDDPPSLGATSPLAPARCDGAPPVPPAGAPARCPPGDPRWPPGAWCPPRASLGDPLGAARCRPVPSVGRSLFTCMATRSARAPNETIFSFPVIFASSARATKILPQNVRGRNRFSGCVRGRFQIFLVRSENLLYS